MSHYGITERRQQGRAAGNKVAPAGNSNMTKNLFITDKGKVVSVVKKAPIISILKKNIDGQKTMLLTAANAVGAVVACCELELMDHTAWVSELYVSPEARRQGLAKVLITTAAILAKEQAKCSIGATVSRGNSLSLKLFGMLGFGFCTEDEKNFYMCRQLD